MDPSTASPSAIQDLQSRLKEDPQDPVLLSRLASIHEQHGDIEAAIVSLQTLLSVNPQDWQAMMRLSRLFADNVKNKDLRKALDLAKSAHNLAPLDGRASALLGELVYRTGEYPLALSLLEQAANQSSDQPSLFYHLALASYAVGRVADADQAMQKAVRLNLTPPLLDQANQFLALRAAVKDPAQARPSAALAKKILDKNPDDVPALMLSALLAERRGALDEARLSCERVLSSHPLFTPAIRQLAILYSRSQSKSDLDKAYDLAQKARTALPDDLELTAILGLLAYNHADYNKSAYLLRECTVKSANDPQVFYYLGMDYFQLKQPKPCKLALQRALDLQLPDRLAAQARTILKELK
jgi:tetratricopeptide (TPR) repeat protein